MKKEHLISLAIMAVAVFVAVLASNYAQKQLDKAKV